jgi:hypothetical protein
VLGASGDLLNVFDENMQTPISYRWFLAHDLTNIRPWYFVDEASRKGLRDQFNKETGNKCDVYPIARRQDCDDAAFFFVRDGKIVDEVIVYHLTYVSDEYIRTTARLGDATAEWKGVPFLQWFRDTVLPDIADWICEEDMPGVFHSR